MRRVFIAVLTTVSFLAARAAHCQPKPDPNIAATEPRTPDEERKAFRLPPGFEAQLVAAEPNIHKPLNINFDDRGRLWVTDTVEYPYPAPPDRKGRDTVKILDDFGPDGRARRVTTFADGLNIPIGVVPLSGANPQEAIVYSIPSVYRLSNVKGSERTKLYSEFGTRDTHGMTNSFTRGFDGWIYATHGFSNTSTVTSGNKHTITMQSGNSYRMKADGSQVEQWTWGQVNPFGLCFDPLGNLYSADCHTQPIYQLLRGAYYPSFGKPHDGLGFGPQTIDRYDESTAVAGIAIYAADNYPRPFRDCFFIGDVVTNRINQFRITWHGSSPRASLERFLQCDDPWFRPVSIKLGPDGALYVADFYNRIIGHYEVPLNHPGRDRERGRIWRIVYTGKEGKELQPLKDWTKATIEELTEALGDPNLTVRLTAANQLVERGSDQAVIDALVKMLAVKTEDGPRGNEKQNRQVAHGIWILERLGKLDQEWPLTQPRGTGAKLVRVHTQRILGERVHWKEADRHIAIVGLKDADADVRRAAADALGRHPTPANIRPLLELLHSVPADDTHLRHVVRMALRDQMRLAESWNEVGGLEERGSAAIADVAFAIPSSAAAKYLSEHFSKGNKNKEALARAAHHIARHGDAGLPVRFVINVWRLEPDDLRARLAVLKAIEHGTQERGAKLDNEVGMLASQLLDQLLDSRNEADNIAGIEFFGSSFFVGSRKLGDSLATIAASRTLSQAKRAAALTALANINAKQNAAVIGSVLADGENPIALREQASALLAKANQTETLDQLIKALASAPARLQNKIAADLAGSPAGAAKLLDTVAAGKASARLLQEKAVEIKLVNSKLPDVKTRVAKLTKGLPAADQKIQELMARRRAGFQAAKTDVALGAKVFEKSCAICHQIAGKGAKIGPQLDGVGIRGLDRLLEDVLDPNRNVDQAFRLTTLNLKSGQVVFGLVLREEGEVIVLADNKGKEVRVEKGKVDERMVSQQSPMPANIADDIPEADFNHLMAFLLAQRDAPPK